MAAAGLVLLGMLALEWVAAIWLLMHVSDTDHVADDPHVHWNREEKPFVAGDDITRLAHMFPVQHRAHVMPIVTMLTSSAPPLEHVLAADEYIVFDQLFESELGRTKSSHVTLCTQCDVMNMHYMQQQAAVFQGKHPPPRVCCPRSSCPGLAFLAFVWFSIYACRYLLLGSGPVAAAVFIGRTGDALRDLAFAGRFLACSSIVRGNVDIQFVAPHAHWTSSAHSKPLYAIVSELLEIPCNRVLRMQTGFFHQKMNYEGSVKFPNNLLRNVARHIGT